MPGQSGEHVGKVATQPMGKLLSGSAIAGPPLQPPASGGSAAHVYVVLSGAGHELQPLVASAAATRRRRIRQRSSRLERDDLARGLH